MIKSKYVLGDVVVIDGKQQMVIAMILHERLNTIYKLNDGKWYFEDELGDK